MLGPEIVCADGSVCMHVDPEGRVPHSLLRYFSQSVKFIYVFNNCARLYVLFVTVSGSNSGPSHQI
jgi:hypothetical protein